MSEFDWDLELVGASESDEEQAKEEIESKIEELVQHADGLSAALDIYSLLATCLESEAIRDVKTDAEVRIAECNEARELLRDAFSRIDQAMEERGAQVEAWAHAGDATPTDVRAVILRKVSVRKLKVITERLAELEESLVTEVDWLLTDIVTIEGTGIYAKLEATAPGNDLSDINEPVFSFISFLSDPSNNFSLIEERMDELENEEDEEADDEEAEDAEGG